MITHTIGLSGPKLDEVADIWLSSNLEAHAFIDPMYWKNYYDGAKKAISKAELFIFESDGHVKGFLGMDGNYIAGLFVSAKFRDQGIGSQLIAAAKSTHSVLTLSVYEKNSRAYRFYIQQGFHEISHDLDEVTDEFAVRMKWKRD